MLCKFTGKNSQGERSQSPWWEKASDGLSSVASPLDKKEGQDTLNSADRWPSWCQRELCHLQMRVGGVTAPLARFRGFGSISWITEATETLRTEGMWLEPPWRVHMGVQRTPWNKNINTRIFKKKEREKQTMKEYMIQSQPSSLSGRIAWWSRAWLWSPSAWEGVPHSATCGVGDLGQIT